MSIFSRSAISRTLLSGRTLKPMMMALDAEASMTSVSVIAPTPPWMQRTRTSSLESFSSDCRTASTEPCTSALMMRFRSLIWPAEIWLNRSSSEAFCWFLISAARSLSLRSSATWRERLVVVHGGDDVARLGHVVEADDLHRIGRAAPP